MTPRYSNLHSAGNRGTVRDTDIHPSGLTAVTGLQGFPIVDNQEDGALTFDSTLGVWTKQTYLTSVTMSEKATDLLITNQGYLMTNSSGEIMFKESI